MLDQKERIWSGFSTDFHTNWHGFGMKYVSLKNHISILLLFWVLFWYTHTQKKPINITADCI